MGRGVAEKEGWFSQHEPGWESVHVLVCTCVFAVCVPQPAVH